MPCPACGKSSLTFPRALFQFRKRFACGAPLEFGKAPWYSIVGLLSGLALWFGLYLYLLEQPSEPEPPAWFLVAILLLPVLGLMLFAAAASWVKRRMPLFAVPAASKTDANTGEKAQPASGR